MRLNNPGQIAVTATLLMIGAGHADPALAAGASVASPLKLDIRAQSLASALNELALQSRETIFFAPEVVSDSRSPGITGVLTLDDALLRLLAGTGLTAERSPDGVIMIKRAPQPRRARTVASASNRQVASDGDMAEIIITGSRVIGNGNDSPTPVTIVDVDNLAATRPTTVFEGLLDLPVFAGSRSVINNPAAAGETNNNISALNLRGLGAARTLILYDGHRVPPTQQDGLVNVNMIPQMLLKRVDVVTGGVSAVYGSDAIGGVVNFITDRNFDGIKAHAQYGISELHDDQSYEVGIAAGVGLLDGRAHLEGSYQVHHDAGVLLRTDRRFGRERWTLQGVGTAAMPYFMVPYARLGHTTFGGKIVGPAGSTTNPNPLLNLQFVAPGVLGTFNNGSTDGVVGNIQLGGDGAYITSSTLKARLNFNQLYGRFDFDVNDDIQYYLSVSGAMEHLFVYNLDNQLSNVAISANNAFLPGAYQNMLTSRGFTAFTFNKMWTLDSVGPTTGDNYTEQWLVNTGLQGRMGGYRWETWYTYGVASEDNRQNNSIDNGRLAAALDAVTDVSGRVVCRVSVTHPALYPGCVPMNVFGMNTESRDAISYILRQGRFRPRMAMNDLVASIAGAPIHNWAGPINLAMSGEWRRLDYRLRSNLLPVGLDPLDCTGLVMNCIPYNPSSGAGTARYSSSVPNRPPVSQHVIEAAVEADVPLLKDLPSIKLLTANAAFRHARYRVNGSPIITAPDATQSFQANTWKLGLDWHINDELRLRGTRSRDFRAPNLNDLFAPGSITTQVNLPDNLVGVTQPTLLQTGGNPNLIPEIGYTSTLGVVWRPNDQFSLAVDGFDINIVNAITSANGFGPQSQAACYASGGASFYCGLQERPVSIATALSNPGNAAYAVTKWYSIPVNLNQQKTWGLDLESNYSTHLFDRAFSLRGLLTYQPHAVLVQPGAATLDNAGVDFNNQNQGGAVWRLSAFVSYALTDKLTLDWLTRWRSALHHNNDASVIVGRGDPNRNPPVMFSNATLSYQFEPRSWGDATIYLNVQNVFNQMPTPAASAGPQGSPGNFGGYAPGDDPIGRYYSLGIRLKL